MAREIISACPYCGQVIDSEGKKFKNQKDAEYWAVARCDCMGAKETVNKAKLLGNARKEIDDLFTGEDSGKTEPVRELLALCAKMIVEGEINSAHVRLDYRTKATISPGNKNRLSISRTIVQAVKREV